jgi:hypothetical protein
LATQPTTVPPQLPDGSVQVVCGYAFRYVGLEMSTAVGFAGVVPGVSTMLAAGCRGAQG